MENGLGTFMNDLEAFLEQLDQMGKLDFLIQTLDDTIAKVTETVGQDEDKRARPARKHGPGLRPVAAPKFLIPDFDFHFRC